MVPFLLKLPLECEISKYQATSGMLFLETGPVLRSAKCLQCSGTVSSLISAFVALLYCK